MAQRLAFLKLCSQNGDQNCNITRSISPKKIKRKHKSVHFKEEAIYLQFRSTDCPLAVTNLLKSHNHYPSQSTLTIQ